MNKILAIFLNAVPIIFMIALIPIIKNDYLLTILYIFIMAVSFFIKHEQKDYVFFLFGFFIMVPFELFFISTGVEFFLRHSLFGMMPIWIPFLWGYAFVAIKRAIVLLK